MKPNFKSGILFGENQNLMDCEMGKIKVVMNKPAYLGQVILNLSKIVMYEFHYNYMRPKYGNDLTPCYMDTDSLVYHIKTKDFYADITDDIPKRFDTSGYYDNRGNSMAWKTRNVKESKSVSSRKLSDLRITRIAFFTQPMSIDCN